MSELTIVMYHYVRELERTRYPGIKGRDTKDFRRQIEYLQQAFTPVTVQSVIACLRCGDPLPPDALLLTFDDGYIDHYTNVFPVLYEKRLQGLFFPPVAAVRRRELLGINRIHFLLSAVHASEIARRMEDDIEQLADEFSLNTVADYRAQWARAGRFDDEITMYVKRMLQIGLPEPVRNRISRDLFRRYVTEDEAAFAEELYCTEEQLRLMQSCGMYMGSHGDTHQRLDTLSKETLGAEVETSLGFLRDLGSPVDDFWVMSYPHGATDSSVREVLRARKCEMGVTIESSRADLLRHDPLSLPRYDTNEMPLS